MHICVVCVYVRRATSYASACVLCGYSQCVSACVLFDNGQYVSECVLCDYGQYVSVYALCECVSIVQITLRVHVRRECMRVV